MYNLRYKGEALPRWDFGQCAEHGGDCFKFAKQYLKIFWTQAHGDANNKWTRTDFPSRVCTQKEITEEFWIKDMLFLCGPAQNLTLMNNYDTLPTDTFQFKIRPNYENETNKAEVDKQIINF